MLPTECWWHSLPETPSRWTTCPSRHWLHCSWIDPLSLATTPQKRTTVERKHCDPKSAHANDARHPPWVQTQCVHSACSEIPKAYQTASLQHASLEPKARQGLTTTKHCCTPPGSLHHIEWHRTLHCSMDLANSTRQTWICPCQQATCNDQNVRQA